MKELTIAKLELRETGQVAVYPTTTDAYFEFIYRAGAAVEWKNQERCFLTPSQSALSDYREFSTVQNFERLSSAMEGELGYRLKLTTSTIWSGITEADKTAMQVRCAG